MSQTLLRFGLWIILIALCGYVLRETLEDAPFIAWMTDEVVKNAGMLGFALVVGGFIMRIIEGIWKKTVVKRCASCRHPVMHGELYCRAHLREVLAREDENNRRTRLR
jgi:hypothetical protein